MYTSTILSAQTHAHTLQSTYPSLAYPTFTDGIREIKESRSTILHLFSRRRLLFLRGFTQYVRKKNHCNIERQLPPALK